MAALDQCRGEIEKAIGRALTPKEVATIGQQASKIKAKIDFANGNPAAAKQILDNYLDERAAIKAAKTQIVAANELALARKNEYRNQTDFATKAPGEVLRGMFVGSQKDFQGAGNSLGVNIQRESSQRHMAFIADLKQAGVDEYAHNGSDDLNIRRARSALEEGKDPSAFGPNAVKVAGIMKKHQDVLWHDQRQAGIVKGRIENYSGGQHHDTYQLAKAGGNDFGSDEAYKAYAAKTMPRVDWSKSFGGEFANATADQKNTRLRSVWNQFVAGDHLKWSDSSPLKNREIVFNSVEDEHAYHTEFGGGRTMAESVGGQLGRGGRDLAIAKEWGPSAESNINKFIDTWKKSANEANDPKSLADLKGAEHNVKNYYVPALFDQLSSPGGSGVAKWIAAARTSLMAARIGASIPALLGDLPLRASQMDRYGNRSAGSFFSGLSRTTGQMFAGLSKEDRVRLASRGSILLSDVTQPLTPSHLEWSAGGLANKAAQAVMKYGMHNAWTDRIRTNALTTEGYDHWADRGKAFSELSEGRQALFRRFGIDDKQWDAIRKQQPMDLPGGNKVFTPQNVRETDLAHFRHLADPGADERVVKNARMQVADRYRNLMGEIADRTTSTPSKEMQAIILRGTKAGTVEGELLRSFHELKGFVYNYMRNHMGAAAMGYDADPNNVGFGRAMFRMATGRGNMQSYAAMARLVAGGIGVGYIANTLSDVAAGKTPENPVGEHWGDAMGRAFARQSLGIYSDMVMGQGLKPDASVWDRVGALAGPSAETSGELADDLIKAGVHTGKYVFNSKYTSDDFYKDFSKDGAHVFNTAYHSVPGNNLIWTKAVTDYYIYDNIMDMMNPGYKQRMIDRAQKERGQTYLLNGGGQ